MFLSEVSEFHGCVSGFLLEINQNFIPTFLGLFHACVSGFLLEAHRNLPSCWEAHEFCVLVSSSEFHDYFVSSPE